MAAPNVSLWAVSRSTGLPTQELTGWSRIYVAPAANSAGALAVDMPTSASGYATLAANVKGDRDQPVEVWLDGSRASALSGLLTRRVGDDAAQGDVVGFTGYLAERRLAQTLVWTQAADPKRELHISGLNPGEIGVLLHGQAQARGALLDVDLDFTGSVDSDGASWGTDLDISGLKFSPKTTFLEVMVKLHELGVAEFAVELVAGNLTWRMWRPEGRGVDRTATVTFRAAVNVGESPREETSDEAATAVLAEGAEGLYATDTDASALAAFGRRIEAAVSAGNVENQGALTSFAQRAMDSLAVGQTSRTHGLEFGPGHPIPGPGFGIGDLCRYEVSGSLVSARVVQWTLTVEPGRPPRGSVSQGDLIADRVLRLWRRMTAAVSGGVVVGTSQPAPGEDTMPPAAPTGVTVGSDAYTEGIDTYATLIVGWTPVTTNQDTTPAGDVAGYRVQWRPQADATGGWRLGADQAGGSSSTTTFGGVDPGINVLVRVAAYDVSGNQSAWSTEVLAGTESDTTPPAVPSTPTVTPYLGQLRVAWNGLDSVGAAMAADLQFVELHIGLSAGFTPSTSTLRDTFSTVAGERVITDLPYGTTHYARLIAVDYQGNRSAASAAGSATPEQVVSADVFDGAIGSAKLADLAVTTAKINDLAVNNAKVGDLSVGKLTAGTLSVSVTNAGMIRSGVSGQRYELDAAGLRFYNSSDVQTGSLTGSGASSFLTGEFRTALTGTRIVLNPGGADADEIRFYPTSGSIFARIETRTFSSQALIELIGGTSRADGATGQAGAHPDEGYIRWGDVLSTTPRSFAAARIAGLDLEGPQVDIVCSEQFAGPDSTRKIVFRRQNSSGTDIANSVLWLRWGGITQPWLARTNGNCGVLFDTNGVSIVNGAGSFGPVGASAFNVNSGADVKTDVGDMDDVLGAAPREPEEALLAAPARRWRYVWEKAPRPPDTGVVDEQGNPIPWDGPAPAVPWHFGPMAEDLPAALVQVNAAGEPVVNIDSKVGLLWEVARRRIQRDRAVRRALEDRLAALESRIAQLEAA